MQLSFRSARRSSVLVVTLVLAGTAWALVKRPVTSTIEHTQSYGPLLGVTPPNTNDQNLSFPKFRNSVGTLVAVRIKFAEARTRTLRELENRNVVFGGEYSWGVYLDGSPGTRATLPVAIYDGSTLLTEWTAQTLNIFNHGLQAYDGTMDFAGTSGTTWDDAPTQIDVGEVVLTGAAMSSWIGTGSKTVTAKAHSTDYGTFDTTCIPNTVGNASWSSGVVSVVYEYN